MENNKFLNVIGTMSGTSIDGIDVSHLVTDGLSTLKTKEHYFYKYSKTTFEMLSKSIFKYNEIRNNKTFINHLNKVVTLEHINALKAFSPIDYCDLIGFHGQTIFHNPKDRFTLQLGDPKLLSDYFKKNIAYNFRENDILNGGEGAPLAPVYHKHIIEINKIKLPACLINIGGISNLTYWDGLTLIGFDSGPGNCLMDRYMNIMFNKQYDVDGNFAHLGDVDEYKLDFIMKDKFYKKKWPKSLDREYFSNKLDILMNSEMLPEDIMATLNELTFKSITNSIELLPKKINSIGLIGGGYQNKFLKSKFIKKFKNKFIDLNNYNFNSNFIESELIAYISARALYKLPTTFPETTGVKRATSGGEIYLFNK